MLVLYYLSSLSGFVLEILLEYSDESDDFCLRITASFPNAITYKLSSRHFTENITFLTLALPWKGFLIAQLWLTDCSAHKLIACSLLLSKWLVIFIVS